PIVFKKPRISPTCFKVLVNHRESYCRCLLNKIYASTECPKCPFTIKSIIAVGQGLEVFERVRQQEANSTHWLIVSSWTNNHFKIPGRNNDFASGSIQTARIGIS